MVYSWMYSKAMTIIRTIRKIEAKSARYFANCAQFLPCTLEKRNSQALCKVVRTPLEMDRCNLLLSLRFEQQIERNTYDTVQERWILLPAVEYAYTVLFSILIVLNDIFNVVFQPIISYKNDRNALYKKINFCFFQSYSSSFLRT